MRFLAVSSSLLICLGFTASASLLQDPEILIDGGGDAIPISTGINQVQPNASCPVVNGMIQCSFDFVNDTPNIITSFTFQTTINMHLDPALVQASFGCQNGGGFFLGCSVSYDPATGSLAYKYSGVNAAEGDEFTGSDPETGEMEGIPPNRPDCPVCGHFIITLRGWTPGATSNDVQLYSGLPGLTNDFTTAPEPTAALGIGTGLLLLAGLWRRQRRAVRRR